MENGLKITKWISGSVSIIILLLCVDVSDNVSITSIQSFLKSCNNFLLDHHNFSFSFLLLFFLIYIGSDIFFYFYNKELSLLAVQKIKTDQKEGYQSLNKKCEKIEKQLNAVKESMKDDRNDFERKSILHQSKISNTLNSIRAIYDRHLTTYHSTNKRLYNIASKTILYTIEEIKSLIDQYQSIKG